MHFHNNPFYRMAQTIRSVLFFAVGINLSFNSVGRISGNSASVASCPPQEDAFNKSLFMLSTSNEDNYYESPFIFVEGPAAFEMAYIVLASEDSGRFDITLTIIDEDGNALFYHVKPEKLNEVNILKLLMRNEPRKRIRYKVMYDVLTYLP